MNKLSRCFIIISLLGSISHISSAQLPFNTDNAGTVGQWKKQIEVSYGIGFDNGHRCTRNDIEISPVLTIGVHDKVDVVIGYPYVFVAEIEDSAISRISGFSDIGLEVKYRFLDFKKFSMAIKPGVSIPTGNYKLGIGNGKFSYSAFLVSTFTFKRIFIHSNFGYIRNENKCGDAKDIWHISVGFDYEANANIHLVLNSGIEKNPDISSKIPPVFGIFGLYYCINGNVEFALGYKYGCTEPETDHSFILGTTFRF